MERTVWHILTDDSRSRAHQSRFLFSIGQHAEVYADIAELLARSPTEGVILAAEAGQPDAIPRLIRRLVEGGIWLPVVATAQAIRLDLVVAAMRAGALDYLPVPFTTDTHLQRLEAIVQAASPLARRTQAEIMATRQLETLSRRERQVLELISSGLANKEVARILQISPRTVEIHRANLMVKLGAAGTVHAVGVWWSAGSPRTLPAELCQDTLSDDQIGREEDKGRECPAFPLGPRLSHFSSPLRTT